MQVAVITDLNSCIFTYYVVVNLCYLGKCVVNCSKKMSGYRCVSHEYRMSSASHPFFILSQTMKKYKTLTARALDSLVRKSLRTIVTMSWCGMYT